jgi:uncharacterized membrane protein
VIHSMVSSWIRGLDSRDTVFLMTLLCVTLFMAEIWYLTGFFMLVGGAGILVKVWRNNAWFWGTLLAALVAFLISNWYLVGNHMFLSAEWLLCIVLALWTKNPNAVLPLMSRYLLGGLFVLAATWKWISPDFASGSFFNFFLLHDFRIGPIGALVSPLEIMDIQTNARAIDTLVSKPESLVAYLKSHPSIPIVSRFMALVAGFIETLLAILFLLPTKQPQFLGFRDAVFLGFILVTYIVAPVSVFGVLLCTLGFAQSQSTWAKFGYLVLFFTVQILSWRLDLFPLT